MKVFTLFLGLLLPIIASGQKTSKINKYAIGMEINFGHSLLTFDKTQDRWKGKYNPAAGITALLTNRLNQNLIADIGIGFTAYGLILRGRIDKYVIDFASPHLSAGISYNLQNRKGNENFLKFGAGIQLGKKRTLVEDFDTYTIIINGEKNYYPFIRPEIGFRRYLKKRMDGSRDKIAYEFGAFFRYNFETLGAVIIEEVDFETMLEPRGNILGVYFKILIPNGRKRIKIKPKAEKKLPPIIYNPRYLDYK